MNSRPAFPVLETERLILRALVESDIDELFEIFSSEEVMKYYGMYPFKSQEELLKVIKSFSTGFDEERVIRWGLQRKDNGKIIGTCGYHCWDKKNFRAEIGYELSKSVWHKGYMTEAIDTILAYGFESMQLNRIEGIVYPENHASQHALTRMGFKKEGLLREYMCFRGKMTDLLMFSLLKREYADS